MTKKSSHLSFRKEREMQNCLGIYVEEKNNKICKSFKRQRKYKKLSHLEQKTYEDITQTIKPNNSRNK